jgi:glycosyltransferase involved in cell wall biosynthesis
MVTESVMSAQSDHSLRSVVRLVPDVQGRLDREANRRAVKLSIIVPVLNEERTVLRVLRSLLTVRYGCDYEVIVVDDGSTDSTPQLIASLTSPRFRVHRHRANFGKGAALRSGARLATGTHLIPFDADGEYDAEDIPKLVAPIIAERANVVFGSRVVGNNTVYQSYRYALGNRILTLAANILFDAALSDMHTCLKVVPVKVFRSFKLKSTGFGLDSELTAALLQTGVRPFEIPVSYHSRSHAEGKKLTWIDGVTCLRVLLNVRFPARARVPTTQVAARTALVPAV